MALVVPHLDYYSVVYTWTHLPTCTRLQRLSNPRVQYIYGVSSWERITPYRRPLGCIRADTRRTYFSAMLMTLANLHIWHADLFHRYQSRGSIRGERKDWAIRIVRTNTGLSSFQIKGAHMRNSISSFKRALYRYPLELDG